MGSAGAVNGIIGSERGRPDIDFCVWIDLRKMQKTAPVVVVTVADHHRVHQGQIDPQLLRVAGKQVRLSRIHEQAVMLCFDIEAEAVLIAAAFRARGVFRQIDNTHFLLL